jgi:hypothetical protein
MSWSTMSRATGTRSSASPRSVASPAAADDSPGEIVLERGYHADVVIDREQNGL